MRRGHRQVPVILVVEWPECSLAEGSDGRQIMPVITSIRRLKGLALWWHKLFGRTAKDIYRPLTDKDYTQTIGVQATEEAYEILSGALANKLTAHYMSVVPPQKRVAYDNEDALKI